MSTEEIRIPDSPGETFDRLPPQDTDAEQAILGAILGNQNTIADIAQQVKGNDFYRPAHELIYTTIIKMFGKGEPVDTITLHDELIKNGNLTRVGGPTYLHTLIAARAAPASATYYARIVAEKATLRRLIDAGTRVVKLGYAQHGDVPDLVNAAQAEMYAITADQHRGDITRLSDHLEDTMDAVEAAGTTTTTVGIPTGLADLDHLTSGLQSGQMIVIAARPAIGKSTLGLDIARNAAIKHGLPALVFSLEMSKSELILRTVSAESSMNLSNLKDGKIQDDGWVRIASHVGRINDSPLYLDDSPNLTMIEIRAKARRFKQQHDLKLIVIDYLQLMTTGNKKSENRQQEVSEISRNIKLLAKELEVPIIAISQLNRGSEHREGKRPAMSDLRESGSIEQDADMVILLHRDDAYNKESQRAGEADLLVVKHRNGPTRDIVVSFQGHYSRFANWATETDLRAT